MNATRFCRCRSSLSSRIDRQLDARIYGPVKDSVMSGASADVGFPPPPQATCNAARVHRVSAARIYRGKRERANNNNDIRFLWGNGVLDVGRTLKCLQERAAKVCPRSAAERLVTNTWPRPLCR